MIVLEKIRSVFILINIYPDTDPTTPKWKKCLRICFAIGLPLNLILCIIGSARYCYNHFDTNLDEALFALFPCVYGCCLIYDVIVIYSHRREITETLAAFQEIYDQYENDESFKNQLIKTNEKCNKWSDWIIIKFTLYQTMPTLFLAVMSFIVSFIMYGTIIVDHLYLPYKFAMPWDQSTFIGWIFDTIFCTITGITYYIIFNTLLLLYFSFGEYHLAFYKHFDTIVLRIEKKTKARQNAKEECYQLIRLHIRIQNLFRKTAKLYGQFLFVTLICTMLHASLDLFLFDLAIQHNPKNIYVCLFMIAFVFSILFVYCYYGSRSTELYLTMANRLFESNWYELPLDLQKYVLLAIQSAQRPIHYHGFGVAHFNLQTFLKVSRTIVSYYLMFKTLTKQ